MKPFVQFRPLLPAVASDGPTTLDLLVTVAAPALPPRPEWLPRPSLNLALVIDRSGSMDGEKLSHSRNAARLLVRGLTAQDRLAIVTFDQEATVVVPSRQIDNPGPFFHAIDTIESGGTTALFAGWLAGARQVAEHLLPEGFNRVLLLSDGDANEGLTEAAAIAARVGGLNERGISTSAFGLGSGFDEDLMGAIASAGDGTLAQIESPAQLAGLYASELLGLASTIGRKVRLSIRTKHGAELVDLLNDLPLTSDGNYQLPNLRYGQELSVGVRLQLPAWAPNQEIAEVCLGWEGPEQIGQQELIESLTLPVMPLADLVSLDIDCLVAEQMALLRANRERRIAIEELDGGNRAGALNHLASIDQLLAALPQSDAVVRERQLLKEKQELLRQDQNLSRKRLRRESLRSSLNVWESGDDDH
jgi:Ca-activated chloride channel family protein